MRRFISFFLAFVLCLSMLSPVSAIEAVSNTRSTSSTIITDSSFVSAFDTYFTKSLVGSLSKPFLWSMMDRAATATRCGAFGSLAELERACSALNHYFSNVSADLWLSWDGFMADMIELAIKGPMGNLRWQVQEHSTYGYVIMAVGTNLVFCTSSGAFPYYMPSSVDPDTGEEDVARSLGGKWVRIDKVNWNRVNILTEYSFYDVGYALRDAGDDNEVDIRYEDGKPTYEYLLSRERFENGIPFVYCDTNGNPYVNRPNPDEWAQEQDNDYYIDDPDGDGVYDDGVTENNTLIDLDSNMVWFPDGTLNFINNLLYDESTKTYYVDAHSEYDIDNNTYIVNNYHYEYHIDYTSITYIGQTAEYDKTYELYYQLPDGRNSADLTVEELQALNTQIDVLPYIRSADDTSIRALYHFDGNLRDSSYWNYLGEFQWNKGASITYMDAGAFNGALYLDENEHDFTIKLPSNISGNDFTMQFRYYQSYTATPQSDSYIQINSWKPIVFTGAQFISNNGTVFGATSIGNWQEICIQRHEGTIIWFLNGVPVATDTSQANTAFGNTIQFVFGSSQQTYKYFDEFRFINKALYDSVGYTPSAVPFDTNLTLVLPDGTTPVADEYWSFQSSKANLLSPYSLDNWIAFDNSDSKINILSNTPSYRSSNGAWSGLNVQSWPIWNYNSVINSVSHLDTGTSIVAVKFGSLPIDNFYSGTRYYPSYGFRSRVGTYINGSLTYYLTPGTYTFSMVAADSSVGSVTFTLNEIVDTQTIEFNGYRIGLVCTFGENLSVREYTLVVQPLAFNSANEFVYLELVQGNSTDLNAEYVTAVAPVDSDFVTPSLAVRTDLEITGHQLGGVRPSLPTKGLVWALVEDGRITSLQIYNGQAWEEVDGRIWTGSRWVPYYAYDVLLLKDLYDVIEGDPTLDYIYTEAGFWAWLQKAWAQMMSKLDQIIIALGGSPITSNCSHVYQSEVDREPGCVEPGQRIYTCDLCGHKYIELIDAHGHDWIVSDHVPDILDEDGNVVERGYDELTCSVCDTKGRDYGGGPEELDLFDALGDFIADGITWFLDKLKELADSLTQITEIFNGFVEKAKNLAGGYPMFFGAFMALLPEDLAIVLWFAVVSFVVLFVWKRWSE